MQVVSSRALARTAILCLSLAASAFFLARGVAQLMATGWPMHRAKSAAAVHDTPVFGEPPPDALAILRRNIFDPSTGPLPKSLAVIPAAEPPAPGEPSPCDETTRLVASVVSSRGPEWSLVSLSFGNGSALVYQPGSVIEGREVKSVSREAVVLEQAGRSCSVSMFKPAKPPAQQPKVEPRAETESRIERRSETNYRVRRALVNELLTSQAKVLRGIRLVDAKLQGIRRSSLLGQLGLQNGDTLRTINGFDMASPDAALEAYVKLRGANQLSVALVRDGRPMTIEYQIID